MKPNIKDIQTLPLGIASLSPTYILLNESRESEATKTGRKVQLNIQADGK